MEKGLAQAALAWAAPEERNGRDYVLAGELALREHRWQAAEQHLTGALAFADGGAGVEPLLRLLLVQGRTERARQVRTHAATITDAAVALGLGEIDLAALLTSLALTRDRADLVAHCLLACCGTGFVDWRPLAGDERLARAAMLAALSDPALAPLARDRVAALVAA